MRDKSEFPGGLVSSGCGFAGAHDGNGRHFSWVERTEVARLCPQDGSALRTVSGPRADLRDGFERSMNGERLPEKKVNLA